MVDKHPIQKISFVEANSAYVIEASAGTGKTWTIERLFIKALLEANSVVDDEQPVLLNNILVVTFTNDATDELKQRIQEQIQVTINLFIFIHNNREKIDFAMAEDIFVAYLTARSASFDYKKDITVLSRALQNFDMASIYTIHGFCNKVLREYQFDCMINSDFELVTSKVDLIEQLVRDFIRSKVINNPEFKQTIHIVLANLEKLFSSNSNDLSLVERIAMKLPNDLLTIESNQFKVKYQLGTKANLQNLADPELCVEDQRIAKAEFLAELISYVNEYYPDMMTSSNLISYDELIQRVADSISNSPLLSDKLFRAFPIAFIDEFQDTDSMQWEIFSQIYYLESAKRGNVVVVGDPKQAIYRFRGADVDTYIEACTLIDNQLQLNSNFRSHKNIMNFINQLFSLDNQSKSIEDSFLGNGIDYTHIHSRGKAGVILPGSSELKKIAEKKGIIAEFSDAEVQLVSIIGATKPERQEKLLMAMTFEILALLNADPELVGKIAILVTKNKEASDIVAYLAKYGIKAAELKLGNIYATETASSIYAILNSIVDLSNKRNLIRAITCKIFNLPLSLLDFNNPENIQKLEKLQQQFFRYKQVWDKEGVISLIYCLINDLVTENYPEPVLNNRELANIWQLAELLHVQSSRMLNQVEFLFWFKQKIKNAGKSISVDINGTNAELVRLDNDDEQVIITTQHKSKGLEYEILFCPYFKNGNELDGMYDFNYKRPFFSSYRHDGKAYAAMIMDDDIGKGIVSNDNKEAHRLNYVALTRAKSRLYIYLKQNTFSKATGKYNQNERPDKIIELFGYVKEDPQDTSHQLFSYPHFFGDDPNLAIKKTTLLPGVVAYNRNNLIIADLTRFKLDANFAKRNQPILQQVNPLFKIVADYSRQSYSGLTLHAENDFDFTNDYYQKDEPRPLTPLEYNYQILNDRNLKGAVFGLLFHELCENYPFSSEKLSAILSQHNIDTTGDYPNQLQRMLEEAFIYEIFKEYNLSRLLPYSQHELEFNLTINQNVNLGQDIAKLIAGYFGVDHPFSRAAKTLGVIEEGFLVGFIDLFFLHEGKYWVLDYKTNTLDSYNSPFDYKDLNNPIIESMAEHHYYLQYLLYLVAVKRYLQKKLQISDASDLIGGAVYYYVRGIYVKNTGTERLAIYIDDSCRQLVAAIDDLFSKVGHNNA